MYKQSFFNNPMPPPKHRVTYLTYVVDAINKKSDEMLTLKEFMSELKEYEVTNTEYSFLAREHAARIASNTPHSIKQTGEASNGTR